MKIMLQLALEGTDQVIDIHKVVGIKYDMPVLLTLEKMGDGGVRMTYNAIQIPDLTKIQGLKFIRQAE